jgi:hypothetical protein
MFKLKTLLVGPTLAIACLGAFAQAASAPATPRVDKREANQQQRIQQGVASGQLTPRETRRLQRQQARVQTAEANAKADGKVTGAERKHLNKMQSRASKNIHHQKHDAQTATKP